MAGKLLILALAPLSPAQEETAPPPAAPHAPVRPRRPFAAESDALWHMPWEYGGHASGHWGGLRDDLAARGLELEGLVLLESSRVLDGGLQESTTDRVLWLAAARVDLERTLGLARTVAYAEWYALRGALGSADSGDYQVYSNIDGPTVTQLGELWLEHSTADERLRLKLGKFDATTEFSHVDAGLGFLHSSAVLSPTVAEYLPTYPEPAVGVATFLTFGERLALHLGAFNARDDGVPVAARQVFDVGFDAVYGLAEAEWSWRDVGELGAGRALIGAWHHTGDRLTALDGSGPTSGTGGTYAVVEQRLRRVGRGGPGLVAFAQLAGADEDVNPVRRHVALGLVAEGLVPGRESWSTGLYVSRAEFSDGPLADRGDAETAIELFQRVALTPAITVVPDLQLIVDPSGSAAVDDALVATLRVELVL